MKLEAVAPSVPVSVPAGSLGRVLVSSAQSGARHDWAAAAESKPVKVVNFSDECLPSDRAPHITG